VAIISSGLLLHAEMVAEELGIGPVLANEIFFEGDPLDPIVSEKTRVWVPFSEKGRVIEELQAELGIPPEACLAVGDGSTDIPLFERATVGVAVNPSRPEVAAAADIILSELDLRPLLDRLHQYAPGFWSS
jgi:phosphoserine phosphatase